MIKTDLNSGYSAPSSVQAVAAGVQRSSGGRTPLSRVKSGMSSAKLPALSQLYSDKSSIENSVNR